MIILGKHTDDKGTQLEALTRSLLEGLEYTNLACNVVGPGAEELDVTGERRIPAPGTVVTYRLICECKAYKAPIDLSHWLKFLGKLYSAEARGGDKIIGCFVALSGLNGPCMGHYNELKQHRNDITLLAGDDLLEATRKAFPFAGLDIVSRRLQELTERQSRVKEVAYYEGRVYWVIGFEHDAYTILDANAEPIPEQDVKNIREMVEAGLPLGKYIDLQEEMKAKLRSIGVVKFVLAELIRKGGAVEVAGLSTNPHGFTQTEIGEAIQTLKQQEVAVERDSGKVIAIPDQAQDGSYKHFARMYYMLLVHRSDPTLFGLPYYDANINEQLLDVILQTQGNLPLSPDQRARALELLRLSPTALLNAVQPISVIVNGREGPVTLPQIDAAHADIFFQILYEGLRQDFESPKLLAYFHDTRRLLELDFTMTIKVKSARRAEMEDQIRVRSRIGIWHEANAEGRKPFISARALNSAPEPWEENAQRSGQTRQESPASEQVDPLPSDEAGASNGNQGGEAASQRRQGEEG